MSSSRGELRTKPKMAMCAKRQGLLTVDEEMHDAGEESLESGDDGRDDDDMDDDEGDDDDYDAVPGHAKPEVSPGKQA